MDAQQFDVIVRHLISGGTRRRLLHLVASLPVAGSPAT
jgi:hypothetical protein